MTTESNSKRLKLVSIERAKAIIEAYGADEARWPEEERSAAMAMIMESSELQQLLNEARKIDNELLSDSDAFTDSISIEQAHAVSDRIISSLPAQEKIRGSASNWNQWSTVGASAMAASLLIVVVAFFTLQEQGEVAIDQSMKISQSPELDQWLWDDITVDVAQIDEDIQDDGFMGLIELDS